MENSNDKIEIIEHEEKKTNWTMIIGVLIILVSGYFLFSNANVKETIDHPSTVWWAYTETVYYVQPLLIGAIFIVGLLMVCFSTIFRKKDKSKSSDKTKKKVSRGIGNVVIMVIAIFLIFILIWTLLLL